MDKLHALAEDEAFGGIDDLLFARRRPKRRRPTTAEGLQNQLKASFLQPPTEIPAKIVGKVQQRWDMQVDKSLLFSIDPPDIGTQTQFFRGGRDFHIVGYEETATSREADMTSALSRISAFALSGDAVEAEEKWLQQTTVSKDSAKTKTADLQRLIAPGSGGLLEAAPGFQRGIRFADAKAAADKDSTGEGKRDVAAVAVQEDLEAAPEAGTNTEEMAERPAGTAVEKTAGTTAEETAKAAAEDPEGQQLDMDLDELLPVEFPSLQPHHPLGGGLAAGAKKSARREWAHMVDLNADTSKFHTLVPGEMARQWPFELDAFQKEAIYHLECGDSVFVAAHTSAGKTVVAEYAIALAQKHQTKAIYTSPIKALSNQKFRDFKNTFDDVGILTGDVQINPEAKCLIMTTEILRSKLYSQSDMLREVEFVIFDEVHYVSDTDRGVVWEEVIIMLPEQVSLILLSATVPNTYEFASWVGRTKKRDVYVISTPKRPVPLEHYLWSGKTVQKIVGADRKWIEKGYREAKAAGETPPRVGAGGGAGAGGNRGIGRGGGGSGGSRGTVAVRGGAQRGRGGGGGGGPPRASHAPGHMGRGGRATGGASIAQEKTLWSDVVRYLRKASLLPACIFVFSRVRCEEFAMSLTNLDFCDASEKTRIHSIYSKSIARLSKEDQDLPQITRLRDLATRGIAVHHGGLLPIVKEIVELLFAQSLVKVLFATETFAVGLNLPTRTVVFSDHRKFDGTRRRILTPGEYTQMAGRAGRRGLDTVGTAIIVASSESNKDIPPADTLKSLILGQPTRLTSQFRLTYNMILSLHRVETLKVEDMMRRSFSENASQSRRPEHEEKMRLLEADLARQLSERAPCAICDEAMDACHAAAEAYRLDTAQMYQRLARLPAATGGSTALFCKGRLIVFTNDQGVRAAGVLAEDMPKSKSTALNRVLGGPMEEPPVMLAVVEVLPETTAGDDSSRVLAFVPALRFWMRPLLPLDAARMQFRAVLVPVSKIEHISNTIVPVRRQWQEDVAAAADLQSRLADTNGASWDSQAWADASLDKVRDVDIVWSMDDRRAKAQEVASSLALGCPDFVSHYVLRQKEWALRDRLAEMRRETDDSNLALLPEYQNRIAVLKHLGFLNARSVVMLKGRVACEIRTADELVLTEMVLNNLLADYAPAEIAALLSIFVYQGKDDTDLEAAPVISKNLSQGLTAVYRIWKDVMRTQEQFHVLSSGDEAETSSKLHFGLMEVVHEWANGSPFKTIAGMTTEQEGTIVRTITRLEETCREVRNIGHIIGDTTLEAKMNAVKESIMRNITTVPSLYL